MNGSPDPAPAPAPTSRPTSRRRLAAALLTVLLVRLVPVLAFGPDGPPPAGDLMVYPTVARHLAASAPAWVQQGNEFGYRAPLFFVYLATAYKIIPTGSYAVAQVASILLGVLACYLVFLLGRRLGGSRAAWAAFWIRGLLPPFILFDTFPMTESLFASLLIGAILLVLASMNAPSFKKSIVLGVLIGLTALTRDSALAYPILFGGALWIATRRTRRSHIHLLLFVLFLLITVLPWMVRNQVVWGRPLPIANTSGVNLYIGNNPESTGKHVETELALPDDVLWGSPAFSRYHGAAAVRYIRENSERFVGMGFRKLSWLLFPSFHRDFLRTLYDPPASAVLVISLLAGATSAIFLVVGLAGLLLRRAGPFTWITLAVTAYLLAGTFVAHGHPRYRDPIDQLLVLHAALLLTGWREIIRELAEHTPRFRTRLALLLVLLLYLLFNWGWVGLTKAGA